MAKVIKTMIDPDDAVMLLIDHQSGLFQLVKDIDMVTLRNNVVALAKVARSPAGVLSGGERQMLILGRALVAEPTLLLMDEPFLGLSREVRDRLLSVIEGTVKGRATILFAEHDAEGAYRLLDRHVIFRNGSVVHEGTRAGVADAKELVSLLHRHFRPGEAPGETIGEGARKENP